MRLPNGREKGIAWEFCMRYVRFARCSFTGIRLPQAATAESSEPPVSELPIGFRRILEPMRMPKERGRNIVIMFCMCYVQFTRCFSTGIRLPQAATAESSEPPVSELPSAFVGFSNPCVCPMEWKSELFESLANAFPIPHTESKKRKRIRNAYPFSFW